MSKIWDEIFEKARAEVPLEERESSPWPEEVKDVKVPPEILNPDPPSSDCSVCNMYGTLNAISWEAMSNVWLV